MKSPTDRLHAELDKYEKKQLAYFHTIKNRVLSAWSFGKIKCYRDYLVQVGYDDEYIARYFPNEQSSGLDFPTIKNLVDDIRISITTDIWLKRNPPDITYDTETENKIKESYLRLSIQPEDRKETSGEANTSLLQTLPTSKEVAQDGGERVKDYNLPPSDKEKVFLFWFQKKAAKQILDNILIRHMLGQLLIAAAGIGKTYIIGAVLRRLIDMGFHKNKSISPWPYFYITKASIVEQTRRVLSNEFGIDCVKECMVTNYDQLRATLGTMFIRERTEVIQGEETIILTWNPKIHPCVFIIDESQSAKNEDSQQSKIINAIADIRDDPVYTIFSSATPFTRISESKYFVVNSRFNDKDRVI